MNERSFPNPYFENVPFYGNLIVEKVLVDYIYPLLFVLKNSKNQRCLSLCFDTRGSQQWLVVPISKQTLVRLLKDKITLDSPFKSCKFAIHAVRDYTSKTDSYKRISLKDIPKEILPLPNEYLEADVGEFQEYIDQLMLEFDNWSSRPVSRVQIINVIPKVRLEVIENAYTPGRYPNPGPYRKNIAPNKFAIQY